MTVKEKLHELVDQMDEREARLTLSEWRARIRKQRESPEKDEGLVHVRKLGRRPSFSELVRMPLEERSKYLSKMPAGIEYEEFLEWEHATVGDGLDDE
ncbi:MAG: hypothetical protein WED87_05080 [Dehalococcoidia bacterium]